jgi:hypothetical protein
MVVLEVREQGLAARRIEPLTKKDVCATTLMWSPIQGLI